MLRIALTIVMFAGATGFARQPSLPGDLAKRVDPSRIERTIARLAGFGTRHSLSNPQSRTRGIGAARAWMKSELESYNAPDESGSAGRLRVELEEHSLPPSTRAPNGGAFVNVLVVLPGIGATSAEERCYVVAHYDSMPSNVMDPESDAPGANDNASGTAAAMEIARVLSHEKFQSTIVVLLTAGEEQGLLGAKAHADAIVGEKVAVRGVLNNDIIGDPLGPGGDPARAERHRVRVLSEGLPRNASAEKLAQIRALSSEGDGAAHQLARYVAEVGIAEHAEVQAMLVYRPDRFLRGGDHLPFSENGFPAVRFCEVYENYAHQHQTPRIENGADGANIEYGDLPKFVDAGYVADVARLNLLTLVHLANAPSSPARARIVTEKPDTRTTLRWDAGPEQGVARYEVVWRETTEATWSHARDVGNVTEATLDLSKDNLFFGVRALGADGYRSPVSFCGAARE
jgi:acetylornithine deacetylase/succinyl-diaminopimelate desuccinylase-like protein